MTDLQEEGIEGASFLDGLISQETRRRTREQTQPLIDACCSPGCIRSTVITVGIASLLLTTLLIAVYLTKNNASGTPTNAIDPYAPPYWMLNQITQAEIATHLKFLSDDLLEGRAPGTRGESLTASYIASHFRSAGLSPLNQLPSNDTTDSFIHKVPLRGLTAKRGAKLRIEAGDDYIEFALTTDFTADSDLSTPSVSITNAEMIFVGNCVYAPKFGINNFQTNKSELFAGKILVCLNFAPNLTNPIANEFYSLVPHKLSYANALGALGVLMVHSEETTGYTWDVYQNRFGVGEQVGLRVPKEGLSFKGWIREHAANQIAELNGIGLGTWVETANNANFEPMILTTTFTMKIEYDVRNFSGQYVVGYLGPDPISSSVLLTAHHDHLGIRPVSNHSAPSDDDRIYSGAVDNASGLAALITSAYAISALYKEPYIIHPGYEPLPLQKTVLFMTSTADENMLGNQYFVDTNFCAWYNNTLCGIVAAISYNVMNVWGKTYEAEIVGKNISKILQTATDAAIKAENMESKNRYYGVSHGNLWPFLFRGIPSINFATGSDKDPNPYLTYKATRQYRPTDVNDYNDMEGVQQQAKIALSIAYSVAISNSTPVFNDLEYINLLW